MRALKKAKKLILTDQGSDSAKVISGLVDALERDAHFSLTDIYKLDYVTFKLALSVLEDWRIDRYHIGKAKFFNASNDLISIKH
jgi:hypothetical protein